MNGPEEVFRDDFIVVRNQIPRDPADERVAVKVGRPVEHSRPTVVDARSLRDALNEFLEDGEQRGDDL